MAFLDVFKILILPALIAAALYGLISYIILPLYRSHHQRYAEYLPLGQLSERTSGFRTRLKNSFTRFLIPRALHWRYDFSTARYGEDRRGSDGSGSVELFGAEEGESMVGFDISRRRTEEARWGDGRVERAQEVDSNRRLSRELEEGFRDESEDEEGNRDDRRR